MPDPVKGSETDPAAAANTPGADRGRARAGEATTRRLGGGWRLLARVLALAVAAWGVACAAGTFPAHLLRAVHLGLVLALIFVLYPMGSRDTGGRPGVLDLVLALLSLGSAAYVVWDFERLVYRSVTPNDLDRFFGLVTMFLVLEAGRRTTGWVLPALGVAAIAYALAGPYLPHPWTHRGYSLDRLLGLQYLSLEGIFGTPLDVSATFIILFTVYGALLDRSGAARFFVDLALSLVGRSRAGPGRTVTLASFLLGGPSGSGVATTVTLATVTYPLLRRAGYSPESAGAILAAGGIGAVISPPVMGAASFLMAELTGHSYLEVIRWALIPTLLYYVSILLMIELDAARLGAQPVAPATESTAALLRRYGYHLTSLFAIVAFMLMGYTVQRAVLLCMALAVVLSYVRRETALTPRRLLDALEDGAVGILPVAATCATAGILIGVVNLTGLGLKFSGILVDLAGGLLLPTLLLTAAVLLVLGLALPITASYLVAAVITAPALEHLGIPAPAAHMFIFYYALLSEVSPPTALSCFAVSAVTGGNPYATMWQTWRYALPAFLVPFMVVAPGGAALLSIGSAAEVGRALAAAALGIGALVAGVGGWWGAPLPVWTRAALVVAGLGLLFPAPAGQLGGLLLAGATAAAERWRRARAAGAA